MLEPVQVEAYGSHMPLNQLATISVPEPRLISVQVWDKSMVKAVEKAIIDSNTRPVAGDRGQVLRLRIPSSTRSAARIRQGGDKYAEAARVAVRHVRRDGLDTVKKPKRTTRFPRDDQERLAADVQKATDATISGKSIKSLAGQGKEILTV